MLKIENLSVSYDGINLALDRVNLQVEQGEFVAVIGSSGSGKSTLLKSINFLVKPSQGKVYKDELDIGSLDKKELRELRRDIGFIFQDYNLIEGLSVLDNVLVGRLGYKSSFTSIFGIFNEDEYQRACRAIRQVGLEDKIFQKAGQLSGGQKQRVAIAKTLCQRPSIILADEPVASLDLASAQNVMDYFQKVNQIKNMTIIINLHDVDLAKKYCKRIVALKDGRIFYDGKAGDLDEATLKELYK